MTRYENQEGHGDNLFAVKACTKRVRPQAVLV